jgi:Arc/MetJ-type ribon-helix-helix transcriptional regulator
VRFGGIEIPLSIRDRGREAAVLIGEERSMSSEKIAITIDDTLIKKLDGLVKERIYPNRSKIIQEALKEKLSRIDKSRLALECKKLDPSFEQSMAEEGFSQDIELWPQY